MSRIELQKLISDKTKCCGCTACANICPQKCIVMKPDFEGFLYPEFDIEKCIHCELCRGVCPVENKLKVDMVPRQSFVMRSKNMDTVLNSTSGGFFTPLADYFLNSGGIICAAAFDSKFNVVHTFINGTETYDDCYQKFRGSKYVQSQLDDCYSKIKEYLENGNRVCFIGTTCQVYGLKGFLRTEYESLVTIDLVCHGTPSPKLWRKYINYQINKYKSPIISVSFRNKTYGYHSGTMKICFQNGKIYYGSARVDYMLKSFFKEISSRPICYQCPFKTLERCSDLTMYDCWHADKLVLDLKDDDCGYTNLIVQSPRGMQLIERMKDRIDIYPANTEKAVKLDGIMVRCSAKSHPLRSEFYKELDNETLRDHIQRFLPISKKDFFLEKSKGILYRLGLLRIIRKAVKKK